MRLLSFLLFFLSISAKGQLPVMADTTRVDPTIYVVATEPAIFDSDYTQFLKDHLRYPDTDKALSGKVFVKFVIEPDGSVTDLKIVKGLDSLFNEEALRVTRLTSGHWIPAKLNGKIVRFSKTLQFQFKYVEPETPNFPPSIHPDSATVTQVGEPPVFKEDYTAFLRKNLRYPPDAVKKKSKEKCT